MEHDSDFVAIVPQRALLAVMPDLLREKRLVGYNKAKFQKEIDHSCECK